MQAMISNFSMEFNKIGDGGWAIKGMPDALYYADIYYGVNKPTSEINSQLSDNDVQRRAVAEGIYYSIEINFYTECQKTEMKKLVNKMFT